MSWRETPNPILDQMRDALRVVLPATPGGSVGRALLVDQRGAGVFQPGATDDQAVAAAGAGPRLAAELRGRLDAGSAAAATEGDVAHGESSQEGG
jgi:hypothetical protein